MCKGIDIERGGCAKILEEVGMQRHRYRKRWVCIDIGRDRVCIGTGIGRDGCAHVLEWTDVHRHRYCKGRVCIDIGRGGCA